MLITDDLLLNHQRCRRRSFLDTYGDLTKKDPPNDYALKLLEDKLFHERSLLTSELYPRPTHALDNWQRRGEETLKLMKQGVEKIQKPILHYTSSSGITLLSSPTLLIRQPGSSDLGNWYYTPVSVKFSKRPKLEYQIIAAFQALVLATTQNSFPERAGLILRNKRYYPVNLTTVLSEMQTLLSDCFNMLRSRSEPEVFISRNRCSLCQWYGQCHGIARRENHLSLIPGITPSRYALLKQLHLTTVETIGQLQIEVLQNLPGFSLDVADKLIHQAQSTLENKPILRPMGIEYSQKLLAHCFADPVELYFDIESEPDQDLAYLHGVLIVNRLTREEKYHPLLAETADQEPQAWVGFLNLVHRYPTAPIFHFCSYEVRAVKQLANRYGIAPHSVSNLINRFVDLHDWITRAVTLPIESYGLKPIAQWLGFKWRDDNADGIQSIYWYSQWQKTGENSYRDLILRYNEDDCRATYHVKGWFMDFLNVNSQQKAP